jgi:hypothetical protein
MPALTPKGEALVPLFRSDDTRTVFDSPEDFDAWDRCITRGLPSTMLPYNYDNGVQILQSPGYVVVRNEIVHEARIIPLDGRPHKSDIEPTFYGEPIGHWDGDTLVIEAKNYKRWSLDDWYYQNPKEYRMHTEALRTVERLRRVNRDTIAYEFTVDDPKIFTKPWSVQWEMKRHPEWDKTGLYEMVCNENNRCEGGKCKS